MHSRYLKEHKVFWLILKESVRVGRCREKNLQCRITDVGLGVKPPAVGGKGVWGQGP